jgi:hypothetical protein
MNAKRLIGSPAMSSQCSIDETTDAGRSLATVERCASRWECHPRHKGDAVAGPRRDSLEPVETRSDSPSARADERIDADEDRQRGEIAANGIIVLPQSSQRVASPRDNYAPDAKEDQPVLSSQAVR